MSNFKQPIPTLDLRKLCRDHEKVWTCVRLQWGGSGLSSFDWILLGQIRLHNRNNRNFPGVWVLDSYLGEFTDVENDSAFILSMELIGVEFEAVRYGRTFASGYINPSLDTCCSKFHVPPQDYNPFDDRSTDEQKYAKYIPEHNTELYRQVRGKRVEIITGDPWNEQPTD